MNSQVSGSVEAITNCPQCGRLFVHYMRQPNPNRRRSTLLRTLDDGTELHVWGGTGLDERRFDVIRTCVDCGHEWGQR